MKKWEQIDRELQEIADANGGTVTQELVVEKAKDPSTSVHSEFDWNDTTASQSYRLIQAERIIRVCVEVIQKDSKTIKVRAWTSLREDRASGAGYRRTVVVLEDPHRRGQLLDEAKTDAAAFRRKYAILTELAGVLSAMADAFDDD